jgi:hypothetical protein
VETLGWVNAALGPDWYCEIRQDNEEKLEAVLGARSGPSAGVMFSVFQQGERLVFIQLATGNPPAAIFERATEADA